LVYYLTPGHDMQNICVVMICHAVFFQERADGQRVSAVLSKDTSKPIPYVMYQWSERGKKGKTLYKIKQPACHLLSRYLVRRIRPRRWRWHVPPPKRRFTFNELHGIISQKIELLITTAVRTSNLTRRYIPGVRSLHNHRCENLKYYRIILVTTVVIATGYGLNDQGEREFESR
jgi:hypothetical protein